MHVYCNFVLLTSNEKLFEPPTFFGLATPLVEGCTVMGRRLVVGGKMIGLGH